MLPQTATGCATNNTTLGGKKSSSANNSYRRFGYSPANGVSAETCRQKPSAPAKKKSPVYIQQDFFVRKAENEPCVYLCSTTFQKLKIYQISNILYFRHSSMFIDNRKKCMKCVCKLYTRSYNHRN